MICVNEIFQLEDEGLIRVLWISEDYSRAYVIGFENSSLPEVMNLDELEQLEKKDEIYSFDYINEAPKKHIELRDTVWTSLQLIVYREPDIYIKKYRNKLISEAMQKSELARKSFYKYLKRYWQRGKTLNALLPDYRNCGTGTNKPDAKLSGRKPKNSSKIKTIKITDDIMKIFLRVFKEYNKNADKFSYADAYKKMLFEYFPEEMKKSEEDRFIPSYRQFVARYKKFNSPEDRLKSEKGERIYDKDYRPILGESTSEAYGPGSKYQIDATVGDIYLVSELNRKKIIGRPVIYFCIDVFSRMVAGMYVGLEGPSMAGASMAIINCAEDKMQFAKSYGVDINKDDWPVENLPETFLGDNGEMKGITPENMIRNFGIRVQTTGSYRADAKGIVERFFKTINDKVRPEAPGFVLPDHRARGGGDYRLDAQMNLSEFIRYLIPKIILHNRTLITDYPFDEQVAKAGVMHKPKDLWNWGIKRRAGLLRTVDLEQLKASLYIHKKATVTKHGIKLHNDLYFTFPIAMEEDWFIRVKDNKAKVDLAYNPRDLSVAYIYYKNKYHRARPTAYSDLLKYNLEDYFFYQECLKAQEAADRHNSLSDGYYEYEQSKKILKEVKEKANGLVHAESKTARTKDIKANRAVEKEYQRQKVKEPEKDTKPADVISIDKKETDSKKKAAADRLRALRNKKFNRND
ncbi:Mu transposase C-terminal domain-containing protein [Deferribacteres bacterium DY0037]